MDPLNIVSSQNNVDLTLLKKAQDLAGKSELQLINSIAPPVRSPSPPGVGQKVDFSA